MVLSASLDAVYKGKNSALKSCRLTMLGKRRNYEVSDNISNVNIGDRYELW